jgi:hypothetical protein
MTYCWIAPDMMMESDEVVIDVSWDVQTNIGVEATTILTFVMFLTCYLIVINPKGTPHPVESLRGERHAMSGHQGIINVSQR